MAWAANRWPRSSGSVATGWSWWLPGVPWRRAPPSLPSCLWCSPLSTNSRWRGAVSQNKPETSHTHIDVMHFDWLWLFFETLNHCLTDTVDRLRINGIKENSSLKSHMSHPLQGRYRFRRNSFNKQWFYANSQHSYFEHKLISVTHYANDGHILLIMCISCVSVSAVVKWVVLLFGHFTCLAIIFFYTGLWGRRGGSFWCDPYQEHPRTGNHYCWLCWR